MSMRRNKTPARGQPTIRCLDEVASQAADAELAALFPPGRWRPREKEITAVYNWIRCKAASLPVASDGRGTSQRGTRQKPVRSLANVSKVVAPVSGPPPELAVILGWLRVRGGEESRHLVEKCDALRMADTSVSSNANWQREAIEWLSKTASHLGTHQGRLAPGTFVGPPGGPWDEPVADDSAPYSGLVIDDGHGEPLNNWIMFVDEKLQACLEVARARMFGGGDGPLSLPAQSIDYRVDRVVDLAIALRCHLKAMIASSASPFSGRISSDKVSEVMVLGSMMHRYDGHSWIDWVRCNPRPDGCVVQRTFFGRALALHERLVGLSRPILDIVPIQLAVPSLTFLLSTRQSIELWTPRDLDRLSELEAEMLRLKIVLRTIPTHRTAAAEDGPDIAELPTSSGVLILQELSESRVGLTMREIEHHTDLCRDAVRKNVNHLEGLKLVESTRQGNSRRVVITKDGRLKVKSSD